MPLEPNHPIIPKQGSDEPVNYAQKIYHLLVGIVVVIVAINVAGACAIIYWYNVIAPEQAALTQAQQIEDARTSSRNACKLEWKIWDTTPHGTPAPDCDPKQ